MTLSSKDQFLMNFMVDKVLCKLNTMLVRASLIQRSVLILSILGKESGLEKLHIFSIAQLINLDPNHQDLGAVVEFLYFIVLIYFGVVLALNFAGFLLIVLKRDHKLEKVLQNVGVFHWNVMFLPVQNVFGFILMTYHTGGSGIISSEYFLSRKAVFANITAIAVSMNLALGLFLSYLNFSYCFENKSSRRLSVIDITSCLVKSFPVIEVIFAIAFGENGRKGTIVFICLLEGINLIILKKFNPFFHFSHAIWNLHVASFNFGLGFAYCITIVLSYSFITPFLGGIICYGLIFQILKQGMEIQQNDIFIPSTSNYSETHIIRILSYLADILSSKDGIQAKNNKNLIYCHGMISTHREKCYEVRCYCKYSQAIGERCKIEETHQLYDEFVEKIFISFCEDKILVVKNNTWVKIIYAQILLKLRSSFYPKVLQLISSIPQSQRNFFSKIAINQINVCIAKSIRDESIGSHSKVDLMAYLNYKIDSSELNNLITEATNITMNFWTNYKTDVPNLEHLYNLGKKFNQMDARIASLWSKCIQNYNDFMLEETIIYAGYKNLIANNRIEANKLKKNYEVRFLNSWTKKSENIITNSSLSDPTNILLVVSMDRARMGIINSVTTGEKNIFGHNIVNLRGVNLNVLLPNHLHNKHDAYLNNHLHNGSLKFFYKDRLVFVQHKEGYIVPVCLFICPLPNIEKGLSYISIMKPLKNQSDYIISSKDGHLLSWTQSFQNDFIVTQKNNQKIKISNFCPLFDEIIKFIDTYEWIISNVSESEQENYFIIKKLFDIEMARHPELCSKLDGLDNEETLLNIAYVNKKLQGDGLKLDFMSQNGIIPYLCSLDNSYSGKEEHRYFKLSRNLNNKFHTKLEDKLKINTNLKNDHSYQISKVSARSSCYGDKAKPVEISYLGENFINPKPIDESDNINLSDFEKSNLSKLKFEDIEDNNINSDSNEDDTQPRNSHHFSKNFFMNSIINTMEGDTISQGPKKKEGSIGSVRSRGYTRPITQKTNRDKADILNKLYGVIVFVYLVVIIVAMFNFYFYSKNLLN